MPSEKLGAPRPHGLREHGTSRDVALPQIAVMGDQSSGSSVLEALSGVPFGECVVSRSTAPRRR